MICVVCGFERYPSSATDRPCMCPPSRGYEEYEDRLYAEIEEAAARAERAEAEVEQLKALADSVNAELHGYIEKLMQTEDRLASETKAQDEALALLHKQVDDAEARLAEVVERVRLAASTLQQITDALHKQCRKDLPHSHTMLRQADAAMSLLDAAAQPKEESHG